MKFLQFMMLGAVLVVMASVAWAEQSSSDMTPGEEFDSAVVESHLSKEGLPGEPVIFDGSEASIAELLESPTAANQSSSCSSDIPCDGYPGVELLACISFSSSVCDDGADWVRCDGHKHTCAECLATGESECEYWYF